MTIKTNAIALMFLMLGNSFAVADSSWKWSAEVGIHRYDYSEQTDGIKSESTSLNLGINGRRVLVQEKWDLKTSATISAFNASSSTSSSTGSSVSASSYYGAELAAFYLLPPEMTVLPDYWLKTGLGIQGWGMIVPGNSYGIKFVAGPELILEITRPKDGTPLWQVYAKIAPLSDQAITIQMSSYKVNLGGSYHLAMIKEAWPVDMVVDLERIYLNLGSTPNPIEVSNLGLGLRLGF